MLILPAKSACSMTVTKRPCGLPQQRRNAVLLFRASTNSLEHI